MDWDGSKHCDCLPQTILSRGAPSRATFFESTKEEMKDLPKIEGFSEESFRPCFYVSTGSANLWNNR
jgi:hypothetical protein